MNRFHEICPAHSMPVTKPTMSYLDAATNLAFFLLENTGSVLGTWRGRMTAADQRKTFGQFMGKGTLTIDGSEEIIRHSWKVCFGLDYDCITRSWRQLGTLNTSAQDPIQTIGG